MAMRVFSHRNEDRITLAVFGKMVNILWPRCLPVKDDRNASHEHGVEEWSASGTVTRWLQTEFGLVHRIQKNLGIVAGHVERLAFQLHRWGDVSYLQKEFVKMMDIPRFSLIESIGQIQGLRISRWKLRRVVPGPGGWRKIHDQHNEVRCSEDRRHTGSSIGTAFCLWRVNAARQP